MLPAVGAPNSVLQLDFDVTSFAGVIHNFQDPAVTAWVPQDWSRYEGFALWLYGTGSGTDLFVDLIENRSPGSTRDDAERWTAGFKDDFVGWKQLRFPFASLIRKDIGNGAPNDGLALDRGPWLGAGRARHRRPPPLLRRPGHAVRGGGSAAAHGGLRRGILRRRRGRHGHASPVRLSRPLGDADPDEVTVGYTLAAGTATADRDYTPADGTLTFTRGGATEQTFDVATLAGHQTRRR